MASEIDGKVVPEPVDEAKCVAVGKEEDVTGDIVLDCEGIEQNAPLPEQDMELTALPDGRMMELDAENFRVIRGRDREMPNPKKVKRICRAIKKGWPVKRVAVYQDSDTSERFAPGGCDRVQSYEELGLPVPVILHIIPNAKARAEEEACYANEDNAKGRTDADKRFQAGMAFDLLTSKLGRPPKPKELADATRTGSKFARTFLRNKFTATDESVDKDELESRIPSELQKVLDDLEKITPVEDWEPGETTKPILADIHKKLRFLANHKCPEPAIASREIKAFMKKHDLNNVQMAKLAEVTHTTISRWLADKPISETNMRIVRQVLSYTREHITTLLDDESADVEAEDGNE